MMGPLRNKKILVTGGTGFIGRSLVRAMVQAGSTVRTFDNDARGSRELLADISKDVEFVDGDIRNASAVREAVKGCECVCHLAFINGTKYFYSMPELVLDVGVRGMLNVIDACIQENVSDLVLASSSEVYQAPPTIPTSEDVPLSVPDPLNPRYSYGGAKIISELLAINYGRKYFERVVIFRPHNVYGPAMGYEHVIPELTLRISDAVKSANGSTVEIPIQGSGLETRSFVYIDDFTEGLMKVICNGEHLEIYHIGTEDEVTIAELVTQLGEALGHAVKVLPGKLATGSVSRRCPDISKLRTLGFKPKVSLSEGLKRTGTWYLAHPQPSCRELDSH